MTTETDQDIIQKIYLQGEELTHDSKTIGNDATLELLDILTTKSLPIEAQLDSSFREYHTALKCVSGSEERNGLYMLIDALEPDIGNIKIQSSNDVILKVFDDKYLIVIIAYYVGMVPKQNLIRLTLPSSVTMMEQRRGKYRVRIDPAWEVRCGISRPSGTTFQNRLLDISAGGFRFESVRKQNSTLLPNSIIKCNIKSQVADDVNVSAKVLACEATKHGIQGRCRFVFRNSADEQKITMLVATFQRLKLQKRQKFSSWLKQDI